MKRLVPFLFALLLFPLIIKGQSGISVEPGSFVLTGTPTQTDISYHITVTNVSTEVTSVFWSFRLQNNPATWLTWICDKNLCYTPELTSCPPNKPNVLQPNESFDLQVHMNPREVTGSGDYDLNILDENGNIIFSIDGQFLINLVSSNSKVNDIKLTLFPNPTPDYFEVSELPGLKYIEIFNILGNKMKSFEAIPQRQYNISDLTEGIYLVRLVSSTGKIIKTVRLSKR